MPIDRDQLYNDQLIWLPDSNILTEVQQRAINEQVIAKIGDDDIYYAEVLCKSLKAVAIVNKAKNPTNVGELKKDKVGDTEREWFQGTVSQSWDDYIDNLSELCPLFGYYELNSANGFIRITTSSTPDFNPCDNVDTGGF